MHRTESRHNKGVQRKARLARLVGFGMSAMRSPLRRGLPLLRFGVQRRGFSAKTFDVPRMVQPAHAQKWTPWSDPALYSAVRRPVDEAYTLPGSVYHDESFFEAERERVFKSSWVAVAETCDVAQPGDVLPTTVSGAPILLANDKGTIRAFHNVCRHRGAQLVQEKCTKRRTILCPYHRWGYSLDGRLRATPDFDSDAEGKRLPENVREKFSMNHVKDFDKASNSLYPARVDFAFGLAFVNLDGQAPPLSEWLGDLLPALADHEAHLGIDSEGPVMHDRKQYTVDANWKLLVENYLEYYHLPAVHPELCNVSGVDEHRRHQGKGMYMCFATDPLTKGGTPIDPGRLPPFPTLRPRQQEMAYHVAIFPNVFFSVYPDAIFRVMLQPQSAGKTTEQTSYLTHKGARDDFKGGKAILDEMFAFWDQINTEDIQVVEKVHVGTSAPTYQGGRFSFRFEEPVHRFQNMVVDKMISDDETRFRIPEGDTDYPELLASMQEPETDTEAPREAHA